MPLIIAASSAAFIFSLIVMMFGRGAFKRDLVRRRLDGLSDEAQKNYAFAAEDAKSFIERVVKPLFSGLVARISAIIPQKGMSKDGDERQKQLLQQAGWTISLEEFTVLRIVIMISCAIVCFILSLIAQADPPKMFFFTFAGVFGAYTVIRFVLTSTGTKRKASMEKQLPDMLDLLSVSVSAGLGFERAMLHITETMDGPLIDEFAVTYREMSMGRARKEALTLLGERCGVEDLSSVTSALVQAGQLGIPISNVLQSQSAALRRSRRSKVQEKAAKVSTKILIPMVAFIFPVLIIVLMGPSLITIVEQFS